MSCSSALTSPRPSSISVTGRPRPEPRILPLFLSTLGRHRRQACHNWPRAGAVDRVRSRRRARHGHDKNCTGFLPVSPELVPATLFARRKYWAQRFGIAPFLPTTRAEMDELGWDSCDVILVTGDAYVDHPSFGMALVGRLLEAHGFRVGILAQPDWRSAEPFRALGRPNLFWGVTAGNMDSMVNRYTSDRQMRRDDAYSPDGAGGLRPDRAVIVYAQRCREAFGDVPVVIGGIEASLRRIAHYDYWSDKVRRSVLVDARGRPAGLRQRRARDRRDRASARGRRGAEPTSATCAAPRSCARAGRREGWTEIDSTTIDTPGPVDAARDPYAMPQPSDDCAPARPAAPAPTRSFRAPACGRAPTARDVGRPHADFEQCRADPVLYAHASRILHLEANPGNARALVQRHGDRDVWLNPPPLPLTTPEMDALYELPYTRVPHPRYGDAKIPAYEMIRFSVTIMRGCFGGCSFCSITEHEGRIIQNRSETSILREIETHPRHDARASPASSRDLGGPTANMYRLACKSPRDRGGVPQAVVRVSRTSATTSAPTTRRSSSSTARRARCPASRRSWSRRACATTSRCARPSTSRSSRRTTSAAT